MRPAQRGAHVPPFSPAQLKAMAALNQLNGDPRFSSTMDLQPGDMQFLNNHVTLHSSPRTRTTPSRTAAAT